MTLCCSEVMVQTLLGVCLYGLCCSTHAHTEMGQDARIPPACVLARANLLRTFQGKEASGVELGRFSGFGFRELSMQFSAT